MYIFKYLSPSIRIILDLRSAIEVYVLLHQQLDRHVVHGGHLLLQHDCLEEGVYTVVTLHVGVLCDEERDASLAQTVGILLHHVIAHDLNITAVGFQDEVAHDMCLRRHGDAVMRIRMLGKISL